MLYLSVHSLGYLLHYVRTVRLASHPEDVLEVVGSMSKAPQLRALLLRADVICPRVYVGQWSGGKPPVDLQHCVDNTTYLAVDNLRSWAGYLKKEWVQELKCDPGIFRAPFEAEIHPGLTVKRLLFEGEEAFQACWKVLRERPGRIEGDIQILTAHRLSLGCPLSAADVEGYYNSPVENAASNAAKCLGTPRFGEYLRHLRSSDLWAFVVGGEEGLSYLYRFLSSKCPSLLIPLMEVQDTLQEGGVDVYTGLLVFNAWVSSLSLRKHSMSSWECSYTEAQLEELLGLFT